MSIYVIMMLAMITGLTSNGSLSIILTHYERKDIENSLISDVMSIKMINSLTRGKEEHGISDNKMSSTFQIGILC